MPIEAIDYSEEVQALLSVAGLPTADLAAAGAGGLKLFGFHDKGRLTGVVGIELLGSVGLLRSLAVHEDFQKSGRGRSLVAHAEAWAIRNGIQRLYLLTVSAADFFEKIGYVMAKRMEAPAAIAGTAQFAGLCPSSSTFMVKFLRR